LIATSVVDLLDAINSAAETAIEPTFAPARAGESRHVALDCARAAAELNWIPATSIDTGLRLTYHELAQSS
jgi:UDP-glucose 4-epimerase